MLQQLYALIRPLLFSVDAEDAHHFVANLLESNSVAPFINTAACSNPVLRTSLFGKTLRNPIGLAAGFDKNGKLVRSLEDLGFGFAELGSVTGRSSKGNPRPRLFRLPQENALINRLGLNGDGAAVVAERLAKIRTTLPFGMNIAKTNDPSLIGDAAIEDILTSFRAVRNLPVSYVTINASCPNTKEGVITEVTYLNDLMQAVMKENTQDHPVLIKLSPDSTLDFVEETVAVGANHGIAGFVCGNTSTQRPLTKIRREAIDQIGHGGLSGKPIKPLGLELCRRVQKTKKPGQIVIGCGGISTGYDAFEFLQAGATVVELYTALVYRGPSAITLICEELAPLLVNSGVPASVAEKR